MNQRQYKIAKGLEEASLTIGELNKPMTVKAMEYMVKAIVDTYDRNGKVLVCGNGGSLCDAMHFAEELTGRFRKSRRALPAISLSDPGHLTCVGNDFGFDYVFARGVEAYGSSGDVLIALSTSGDSRNIQLAVEQARGKGMCVICLLGKGGGVLKGQADYQIIVGSNSTERIQEAHMTILHLLIESIEREMFPENYEVA